MGKITERVTGHTLLIGLLAYPIRHSKSPTMQNEAFAKMGLDYVQVVFEVTNDNLEDAVTGIRALGIRGSNVSMPNKTVVHKYLDEISPAAKLCGAVNTIVNDDGHLTGHNTDGIGFMTAIKESGVDVIGKKMTIVGVGGAATAIEVQAALDGVKEISIFNRKDKFWDRAVQKVQEINDNTECKVNLFDLEDHDALRKEINDSVLFVNATGVGMKPLEGLMVIPDGSYLRPDLAVADVVYAPKMSKLLETAKEAGCYKVINGEGMMLYQGAAAFKLWTGEDMPVDHIKDVMDISFIL